MRWLKRLGAVRTNRIRFEASGAETAGEHAEDQMLERVQQIIEAAPNAKRWRAWSEVRVKDGNWRTEIDLVVATDDTLFLLELKNWSGRLDVHNEILVQHRRHEGGMIEHGNLMKTMQKREAGMRAWLTKQGCDPPRIERKILFYNPRLEFSDAVFEYFGNEVASASEWLSDFSRLAQNASPPPSKAGAKERALHAAIDNLYTWDWVEMYGGRTVRGDIRSSAVKIRLTSGKEVPLHDRKVFTHIEVEAPRGYVRALFTPSMMLTVRAVRRNGEEIETKLPIDTTVRVHAAGQKETELVALRHVRRLRFGRTKS